MLAKGLSWRSFRFLDEPSMHSIEGGSGKGLLESRFKLGSDFMHGLELNRVSNGRRIDVTEVCLGEECFR